MKQTEILERKIFLKWQAMQLLAEEIRKLQREKKQCSGGKTDPGVSGNFPKKGGSAAF